MMIRFGLKSLILGTLFASGGTAWVASRTTPIASDSFLLAVPEGAIFNQDTYYVALTKRLEGDPATRFGREDSTRESVEKKVRISVRGGYSGKMIVTIKVLGSRYQNNRLEAEKILRVASDQLKTGFPRGTETRVLSRGTFGTD